MKTDEIWLKAICVGGEENINVLPNSLNIIRYTNKSILPVKLEEDGKTYSDEIYNRDDETNAVCFIHITPEWNAFLRIYDKGNMVSEKQLVGIPVSIHSIYITKTEPIIPVLISSCGSHIYLYRNMKPYYKFSIPNQKCPRIIEDEFDKCENDNLEQLKNICTFIESLNLLKYCKEDVKISKKSDDLDSLLLGNSFTQELHKLLLFYYSENNENKNSNPEQPKFEKTFKYLNFLKQHVKTEISETITAATPIKKNEDDFKSMSWMVIGCESGNVFLLETQLFTLKKLGHVNDAISIIKCFGEYLVNFKIIIITRDNNIFIIDKINQNRPKYFMSINSLIMFAHININCIVIICGLNKIQFYTHGAELKCSFSVNSNIISTEMFFVHSKQIDALMVSCNNNTIKCFVNEICYFDIEMITLQSMKFGCVGSENNCLVGVGNDSKFYYWILKRTYKFEPPEFSNDTQYTNTEDIWDTLDLNNSSSNNVDSAIDIYKSLKCESNKKDSEIFKNMIASLATLKLKIAKRLSEYIESNSDVKQMNQENKMLELDATISANLIGTGPIYQINIVLNSFQYQNIDWPQLYICTTTGPQNSEDEYQYIEIFNPVIKIPYLLKNEHYTFGIKLKLVEPKSGNYSAKVSVLKNETSLCNFDIPIEFKEPLITE